MRFGKDWEEAYLPIANGTILVAMRSEEHPSLALDSVNVASALLSTNSFFASVQSDKHLELLGHIGEGNALMDDAELKRIIKSVWEDRSH